MSEFGDRGSGIGDRRSEVGTKLDTAIDLAVREMLDVEPPDGLRGRVLARIQHPRRNIVWGAVPLAAAAAIILAVLLPWKSQRAVVNPVATVAATRPVPAQTPPSVVTPTSRSTARIEPKPVLSTVETLRLALPLRQQPSPLGVEERVVAAAVAPDDDASAIDPLAPIAPIVVAGTHPADIAPKDIAISLMAPIAPLQIAPLSPPDRRN